MNVNGLHYHNSLKTSDQSFSKYRPSTEIITQPLTDKYSIGEQIGRGKFAVVKKCTNHETQEVVAAKFIKKRRRGKTCRDEILREVVMLEMALDHPRLVNLKEVYETQTELILITEYCAGGELFTECILDEKFNECDVRLLMSQIVEGLVYLHEKCIVHLDLKPQNILLTQPFPHGSVKICDLGFACLVNTGEDIRDIIGTPDYVAPEVLNYDPLGLYTDMWSLGVLTYVMLTQCSPFAGEDKQVTFCNITTVQLDFPDNLFADISDEAQDFIKKLLIADPHERLTAKECLQHPWITGSPSSSSGLSTVVGSTVVEQDISGSNISLSSHSILDNKHKSMFGSFDSSHDGTSTDESKMVTSDSKSSVSSSDAVNSENQIGRSKLIDMKSDKESIRLKMGDSNSEALNPVGDSIDINDKQNLTVGREIDAAADENKTKELELLNSTEKEIHMDTKCEALNNIELSHGNMEFSHSEVELSSNNVELSHTNMEVSFTQEDLAKEISERAQVESICDNKDIIETNICSTENEQRNVDSRTENKSTLINSKATSSSYVENISKLYDSVEIIVQDGDNDTEMISPSIAEGNLPAGTLHVDKTRPDNFAKGNNPPRFTFDKEGASSSSNLNENPHKRGMCNDSIPSVVTPVNSNETDDEINYDFISVSKRVRNYEQALSPQRSPQISPKSPRSPRIARIQRRSSHNAPYSS